MTGCLTLMCSYCRVTVFVFSVSSLKCLGLVCDCDISWSYSLALRKIYKYSTAEIMLSLSPT